MNRNLICYCVGGLGNRLRALSSCYSIALKTQRNLVVIWMTNIRCESEFNSIFNANLNIVDDTFLQHMTGTTSVYGLHDAIWNEYSLFNKHQIIELTNHIGSIHMDYASNIFQDLSDNIVVVTNNFIAGADIEVENNFLRNILQPVEFIRQKIDMEQEVLKLDKTIIGVHARATDFFCSDEYYYNLIDQHTKIGDTLFVCSDSPDMEQNITNKYQDSRTIITRANKVFVEKYNENASWENNVFTSHNSIVDAVVDIHLLAKTNFKICNPTSTFAHIVERLK